MKSLTKVCCLLLFFTPNSKFFAQETQLENNSIYTTFNQFFDKEIKKQGVKGDWIFKLNEITGTHSFDYNKDTFNDVLMEFNAIPVDGGNYQLFFIVLFKNNENKTFELVDYFESASVKFLDFYDEIFIFEYKNNKINYKLINSKFSKI